MPLKAPQISLPARRIIREAFENLQRVVSPLEAKEFGDTTLQNVQQAAIEIEEQLAARQSLRNMRRLMPLFQGLDHYGRSIDILCNGTPYLPWLWAPIKLILTIASEYVEAFERIIGAYSRIAESLTRFEILGRALKQNTQFQETLAIFYSDILRFHQEAYVFVRRSGWKIFFLTSWGRFQRRFDAVIDDLKSHEELIDKTANAVNISEASSQRDSLRAARTERLDELAKQEHNESSRQYQSIAAWLKIDDTDQQVIFDSVSSEASKHAGTCDWILKQPSLVAWMREKPGMPFLWLEGNPGTGKSVLATQVDTFVRSSNRSLVVRHFCTYSYAASVQYDQILRSLLSQIVRSNSDLVAHVYEEYVAAKKTATIQTLDQLILTITRAVSSVPSQPRYVYVIVDGLDECEAEKQGRVASLLERLAASAGPNDSTVCKILLASRRSPILAKRFRKMPTVSLAQEKRHIESAIRIYSDQKLGTLRDKFSQLGITKFDLDDLSKNIAEKADGTASLIPRPKRGCDPEIRARKLTGNRHVPLGSAGSRILSSNLFYSRDEVRSAVNTLPRKLSEFYGRILSQTTTRFDARSQRRMKSIMGWIAFAKRPLKMIEFRSALAFGDGNTESDDLPPKYIFDMCAPLIHENPDTTFSFIHVSVKDYLQTPESTITLVEVDAVEEHAVASMTCLLSSFEIFGRSSDPTARELRILNGLHGFHVHATEYWVEYLLSNSSLCMPPTVLWVASAMAQRLLLQARHPSHTPPPVSSVILDARVEAFLGYEDIYQILRAALQQSSAKDDVRGLVGDSPSISGTLVSDPLDTKTLLEAYQASIRYLCSLPSHVGITLEELEQFKREHRPFAFTCRSRTCPRSTAGFPDERTLREHELSHTVRITCQVPSCHYPPFPSSRALKAHTIKCHGSVSKVSRIRSLPAPAVPPTTPSHYMDSHPQPQQLTFPAPVSGHNPFESDFERFALAVEGSHPMPAPPPGAPLEANFGTARDLMDAERNHVAEALTALSRIHNQKQLESPRDPLQETQNLASPRFPGLVDEAQLIHQSQHVESNQGWSCRFESSAPLIIVRLFHTIEIAGALSFQFSQDGEQIVIRTKDFVAVFAFSWQPTQLHNIAWIALESATCGKYSNSCCFVADGKAIAASTDNMVQTWDIKSGKLQRNIEFSSEIRSDIVCSPGGRFMAATDNCTFFQMWESGLESPVGFLGNELRAVSFGYGVQLVAVSSNGRQFAAEIGQGNIQVWNIDENPYYANPPTHLRAPQDVAILVTSDQRPFLKCISIAFSPDGTRLAATYFNWACIYVWAELDKMEGGFREISFETSVDGIAYSDNSLVGVSYSDDGRWMISPQRDGAIKFWDSLTGLAQCTIKVDPVGPVWSPGQVAVRPSVSRYGRLASAFRDGKVRIWAFRNTGPG